jgi:trehalose 6-phosphate synthase
VTGSEAGRRDAPLVVVSNRGPSPDGTGPGAGGLVPSLVRALAGREAVWVACAPAEASAGGAQDATRVVDGGVAAARTAEGIELRRLRLAPEVGRPAYDVVANGVLWFLLHGLFDRPRRPVFDRRFFEAWDAFRAYNEAFADAVAEHAAEGAVVVVNDYHLPLVARFLARRRDDLATVHFSHTPFCAPEELAVLPDPTAAELLEGMAAFGACGFHTPRWADAFGRCAAALGVAAPPLFAAPLGPDVAWLRQVAVSPEARAARAALDERVGERTVVVRSERIELSKNILRGLRAFDALLESERGWRGRVVLHALAYPSRETLPDYLAYRAEVEHLAALVNERWGSPGYEPVVLEVADDFAASVAALVRYDVLFVNPLRDGLNLVAKEGPVLNERRGALVLSREAGAYEELREAAFGVHPFDVVGTAAALRAALECPESERAARADRLASLAATWSPSRWLDAVVAAARLPERGRRAGG